MKVGQWSKTRKIYNGVCGSRHEISYGYVYDSDLDARVKYWIGLDAFDQRSLTGSMSGNYVRDNAANHSVRVRVSKLPLDEDGNRIETSLPMQKKFMIRFFQATQKEREKFTLI